MKSNFYLRLSVWSFLFFITFCFLFHFCKKDFVESASKSVHPLIENAQQFYLENQIESRSGNGIDTIELFNSFDLNWGQAVVEAKDSLHFYVRVPVSTSESGLTDSITADMIFYKEGSSPNALRMELWLFPYSNTFSNGKKKSLYKMDV